MADRDTDGFFNRVYDMVRQVPCGMGATYGQIAKLVGEPRRARYVGYALHVNPEPGDIPCHRIVFADGRLAEGFAFGGPDTPCTSIRNPGTYLVTASYSRTGAWRRVLPSADPRCSAHCSKMKALPSSQMDMSTCRPLAGPRAWYDKGRLLRPFPYLNL